MDMNNLIEIKDEMDHIALEPSTGQALPTLEFDPEEYSEDLAALDIPEEQAREFLQTLFNIMHTMVDIGFGLDTVQMFSIKDSDIARQDSGNSLKQKGSLKIFNSAVKTPAGKEENNE